jgi:hypothetical protein
MSDAGFVEADTKLAKEWDREEAVDWSCDCMLLELFSIDLEPSWASCLGLASVLSRLSTPDTAYDMGYVKYEEERVGVFREDRGAEGKEDCGVSVVDGIAQCL